MDFVFEATGHAKHAVDAASALGPNGVATLQGIPGSSRFEIDGGEFHTDLVTNNKALLGVVNSRVRHFRAAVEWLTETPANVFDALVTGVYDPAGIERAIADDDEMIKTVISFDR